MPNFNYSIYDGTESGQTLLNTVDLSNEANRTVIRYHKDIKDAIIKDTSGMGNKIKIEHSGRSGTWASTPNSSFYSDWLVNNREWLKYNDDTKKLDGYFSELTYKKDAKILEIKDKDSLYDVIDKYGKSELRELEEALENSKKPGSSEDMGLILSKMSQTEDDTIEWSKVAKDYDAVRIETNIFGYDIYNSKVRDYYGNTDVIFNPDSIENINTYIGNEYNYEDKSKNVPINNKEANNNPKDNLLSPQEAFDKYGPNDDKFYTSQGLNISEQKETVNKLNSKRKKVLSQEEITNKLHKETQESANKIIQLNKESNQIISDYHKLKKQEEIKETINNVKQKTINLVQEKPKKSTSLKKKTLKNNSNNITKTTSKPNPSPNKSSLSTSTKPSSPLKSSSNKINNKKLGVGLGAAVLAGIVIDSVVKNSDNSNQNNDLQTASNISSFSKRHSTYSLR